MAHEPDWQFLADLQFLLYNRIAGALNEALSSIALIDMPEAQDKPPGYWKERATNKIANVLNLFTAWSYLIRFKSGEPIPERAIRPFHANALLKWLGVQLQLNPVPQMESDPLLHANQETLQEALLLLHSVAYTQGAGVHIEVESNKLGAWFRVKFSRTRPMPKTLDTLLASFGDHWRERDAAFELATARDFVRLNQSELKLIATPLHGEFVFFVRAAGRRPARKPAQIAPARASVPHDTPVNAAHDAAANNAAANNAAANNAAAQNTAAHDAATPVLPGMRAEPAPAGEPAPPRLELLRPLPPTLSELERRAMLEDPPRPRAAHRATPDALSGSGEPGPAAPSVIVPLKIPAPTPPARMASPPAATSNVALTKETQTLAPVSPAQVSADRAARKAAQDPADSGAESGEQRNPPRVTPQSDEHER